VLIWHDAAWGDYLYWQTQDKKTLKRINMLIKDIERNGNEGIGKPEPLKENLLDCGAAASMSATALSTPLRTTAIST
jgi:Txe/YoeB family toxin of Txe-Axe toxin-antitoxin module